MTRSEAGKLGAKKTSLLFRKRALDKYYANPNICLNCGGKICVMKDEKVRTVRIKKFCNHSCSAQYSNKNRAIPKLCIVCSQPRSPWAKKYCSLSCQAAERSKIAILNATRSKTPKLATGSTALRKFLFTIKGSQCWSCGWNKINPITGKCPLTMNHIDGDSTNNTLDNLELLCGCCDSLTPTYKD